MEGNTPTNGRREQGRFEGRVMTRLDAIDKRLDSGNAKMDAMDEKITKLQINVGIGTGLVTMIAAAVSAVVALATTYLKTK